MSYDKEEFPILSDSDENISRNTKSNQYINSSLIQNKNIEDEDEVKVDVCY